MIRNRNTNAGFSSLLANVLGHLKLAEEAKRIPIVDWSYYRNKYSTAPQENTWCKFFENVSHYTLENLTSSDDVFITDGEPGNVPFPYHENLELKNIFKRYIKLNATTTNFINERVQTIDSRDILGVHSRCAKEMRIAPSHPMQPTRSQLVKKIDQKLSSGLFTKIFLAADTQESVEYFSKRYGNLILTFPALRFKKNFLDTNRYLHGYQYGLEFLSDLYMLSSCKEIIAGYSGVSNLALVMRDSSDINSDTNLIWNGRISNNKHFARYHFKIKSVKINIGLKLLSN